MAWTWSFPSQAMMVIADGPLFVCEPSQAGVFERHSWTIRNNGPYPLKLRTHFTGGRCGFSLWLGQPTVLEPGQDTIVWLTWPTPSQPSQAFSRHVEVWTSDPEQPKVKFQIVGRTGLKP